MDLRMRTKDERKKNNTASQLSAEWHSEIFCWAIVFITFVTGVFLLAALLLAIRFLWIGGGDGGATSMATVREYPLSACWRCVWAFPSTLYVWIYTHSLDKNPNINPFWFETHEFITCRERAKRRHSGRFSHGNEMREGTHTHTLGSMMVRTQTPTKFSKQRQRKIFFSF